MLLEALLEQQGFQKAINTQELAIASFTIIQRRRDLLADLPDHFRVINDLKGKEINRWYRYWMDNPINAWTGGNRAGASQASFKVENDQFINTVR